MSAVEPVPTPRPPDLVTFTLMVDGQAVPTSLHLFEAMVSHACNRVSHARFVFRDGDVATQTFPLSESDTFKPGAAVEFKLGYHGQEEAVFKGFVTKHGISARPGRPWQLVVECRHVAFKMTLADKWRSWTDSTDADALQSILGEYSVAGDVASGGTQQAQLVQAGVNDWDFVLHRARANGWLVLPQLDKLDIKVPVVSGTAALTVGFGGAIESFEAEMDARYQPAGAKSTSWAPASGETLEADAPTISEPALGNLDGPTLSATGGANDDAWHGGALASDELTAWSSARVLRAQLAKIRGTVRVRGFATIMPGGIIHLDGLGARFNGDAFVGGVRHEFYTGTWKTDVQIGLDPAWLTPRVETGLLPPMRGLHCGIVKQLASDPESGERILVSLPVMLPGGEGLWARWAQPEAGNERGFVFRPEVGDEVVVGFFDDDPRHPVILGAMYSGKNVSHIPGDDANPKKGYQSREKIVIGIDDAEKVLTFATPGGNQIVLSDADQGILLQDQNGNKIQMGPDGIAIESAGKIEIKATSDATIEGVNISATASAEAKIEGSASATLSGSGRAVIQGGTVMIN